MKTWVINLGSYKFYINLSVLKDDFIDIIQSICWIQHVFDKMSQRGDPLLIGGIMLWGVKRPHIFNKKSIKAFQLSPYPIAINKIEKEGYKKINFISAGLGVS